MHPELTQYDFILDLVSDERFIQNVGNVFSEIGSKTQQSNLSKLISADSLSTNEFEYKLVKILQNLTQFPLWEYTNQYKYYSRLHAINQNLPSSKRINHYLNDIECNWYSIKTKQDYSIVKKRYYKREKILADNVIQKFEEIKNSNSERKKCLVIMNFRHAFGHVGNSNQIGDSWQTCASYLIKKYPDKVANVLLNTTKVSFGLSMPSIGPFFVPAQYSPINKGIWDNAFSEIGNKSLGFDFKKSPFGICQFDLFHMPIWKKYKYQDIFTGFVFYQPLNEHSFSYGFKDIIANGFDKEIVKRAILVDDKSTDPGLNLKYVNKRLKKLRTQEVTIDKKPYLQFESVFELIFGTTLLLLGLLLGFNGFMKRRKITKA